VIADTSRQHHSGEGGVALTAASIADAVGGKLIGDPSIVVGAVAPLDRASRRELSFLGTAKYSSLMATTQAGVVLVSPELAEAPGDVAARIVVAKPQEALL
jgi:UDP-3-O-[3-hydroxymyristoyl] glucosamine N-acyltransferase